MHASWLFVFFFVTWSLATGYLPDVLPGLTEPRYWAMGGVAAILLFASVLLHELGHSLVALRYRIPISQITLFIFGGVAQMRKEPPHPRAEFLIAIAGPIVSFLLAGLCIGMVALLEFLPTGSSVYGLVALGTLLGMVNTQLGLFNLLPGFPLDGGRALRAGLWAWSKDYYRATSQAALVGLLFGVSFGLFGAFLLVGALSGTVSGALASSGGWIVLLGAFLFAGPRDFSVSSAEGTPLLRLVDVPDFGCDTFEVTWPDGRRLATLQKRFSLFSTAIDAVAYDGSPIELRGAFADVDYQIAAGGEVQQGRHERRVRLKAPRLGPADSGKGQRGTSAVCLALNQKPEVLAGDLDGLLELLLRLEHGLVDHRGAPRRDVSVVRSWRADGRRAVRTRRASRSSHPARRGRCCPRRAG